MADVDLMYGADPNGFWNPQAPKYDPNSGQYGVPPLPFPMPTGNGVAPTAGNQRESFHWDRIPDAYRNIPGIQDWANDQSANPNDKVQAYLQSRRASGRTDEGDADALAGLGRRTGMPGFQFDDPYTRMLEGIAQSQMGEVRSNPGLNQLMSFLNKQFGELSTAPGFSPDELSVLRTQAFEPIEELRGASKKRALERTSMRGMLPSSGLNELDMRDIDIAADKSRAAAGRDLAINAIDRRDNDLNRAAQIATQIGLQIPGQQRGEELALASLLYDLPRKSLQDALAVTQGSPTSTDLFSQAVRLAQTNQQNQMMNQQKWAQIAQLLAGLDF